MAETSDQLFVPVFPGTPGDASAELAEVARRFNADLASPEELSLAFADAVVFCRGGDEEQFMAIGPPGAGMIPMYSSELALARGEGRCVWFSHRGSVLVQLVPEGYGVVLDRGSDSEVVLAAWAIHHPRADAAGAASPGRKGEGSDAP